MVSQLHVCGYPPMGLVKGVARWKQHPQLHVLNGKMKGPISFPRSLAFINPTGLGDIQPFTVSTVEESGVRLREIRYPVNLPI